MPELVGEGGRRCLVSGRAWKAANMKPVACSTPSVSGKTKVCRRGGIAFTDNRKNLPPAASKPPAAPCDAARPSEPGSAPREQEDQLICYDKPSWDVPYVPRPLDEIRARRPVQLSPPKLDSALDRLIFSGLSAPTCGRGGSDGLKLLQRTVRQVDSHNRALEKAQMWKRYHRCHRGRSASDRPVDRGDSV